jgi:hypothetical protein
MVFNKSAKNTLEKAGLQEVVSHDWWVYQLVKGVGGVVFYDPQSSILYRQHNDSLVGSNISLMAKIDRIVNVLNGRFKAWNTINLQALNKIRNLLTIDNQVILETFAQLRTAKFRDRARLLEVCGVYRQTWQGTLSLWLATLLKKI